MKFLNLTLNSSSSIPFCLIGNFTGIAKSQEIALVRGCNRIELCFIDKENGTFQSYAKGPSMTFGMIRSITKFKLLGTLKEYLVLGTDSGRLSILEWDLSLNQFVIASCVTFGKTGLRRGVPGQYLASDPKGRAVMVGAIERAKFVYVTSLNTATSTGTTGTTTTNGSNGTLFVSSPLEAHRNGAVCFGIVGLDVGFENPVFASLEVDANESTLEKTLVFQVLDLGLNHVLRTSSVKVPESSNHMIPLPCAPDGPGGLLVCSAGLISYYSDKSKNMAEIKIPKRKDDLESDLEPAVLVVCHAVHRMKKTFFVLFMTEKSDMFKLTMEWENDGDVVLDASITVGYYDTVSNSATPYWMGILKSGFLIIGTEASETSVYQIENLGDDLVLFTSSDKNATELEFQVEPLTNLCLVDTVSNMSPCIDALVTNLSDQETPQIYALNGRGNGSRFTILRHGVGVVEVASSDIPGISNGIWTVGGGDQDSFIVVSFIDATLVLSVGSSVEEVTDTGLLTTTATLWVGQLGDSIVQVYSGGIRHVRADRRVSEWKSSERERVVVGTSNGKQVCVGLASGAVVYFEVDSLGNLNEFQQRAEMGCKILSLCLAPVSNDRVRGLFLGVGCDDNTVRVLSLNPSTCLSRLSMQALSAAADSLLMIEAVDSVSSLSSLFMHMGLANGVLLRTTIDTVTGVLDDTRQRFLGPKSVKLFQVKIAQAPAVLALSVRPWLSYTFQGASKLAPLSYEALDYGAAFTSEQAEEGIVAISGSTLRILTVDKLHQVFDQVSIPLKYTPKRMLLHRETNNFIVIEAQHGTYGAVEKALLYEKKALTSVDGSIPEELNVAQYGHPKAPRGTWASCIRLLNPFSGTTIFQTEFVNNEAAISMADVVFMAHPDERLLVVGTVTGMVIGAGPVTFQRGGLRVYKVSATGLELYHQTDIDGIPQALCAFQGRLLVGVGKLLRIYDLGKKKMLRKCESKDFARNIIKIHTQGDRIITTDAAESIQYASYRQFDNRIVIFADDPIPRWMTTSAQLDYDTMAGGDKFGNIFVVRLDPETSKAIEEDKTGNMGIFERGKMLGAAHKLKTIASFYLGEGISSITKTQMVAGGREVLVYTTFMGTVGILVPFISKEDVEFFQLLEMSLCKEIPLLSGRNHMQFRSSYTPVNSVIDGDLCELYNSLPNQVKRKVAQGLDRSVSEVCKKLDDIRQRVAF